MDCLDAFLLACQLNVTITSFVFSVGVAIFDLSMNTLFNATMEQIERQKN